MTFHVTFLWGSRIQIQRDFSKSTLHQQEWKPGLGSVFLREPGQACRRAAVLLPHVMSMQKMAHWSVQVLPRVLQQLLLHTHKVKINLASERLLSNQTVFFPLAINTNFYFSSCQTCLFKTAAFPSAAAAACNAPQHQHKSLLLGIYAGKADYYSRQFIQHIHQSNINPH